MRNPTDIKLCISHKNCLFTRRGAINNLLLLLPRLLPLLVLLLVPLPLLTPSWCHYSSVGFSLCFCWRIWPTLPIDRVAVGRRPVTWPPSLLTSLSPAWSRSPSSCRYWNNNEKEKKKRLKCLFDPLYCRQFWWVSIARCAGWFSARRMLRSQRGFTLLQRGGWTVNTRQ